MSNDYNFDLCRFKTQCTTIHLMYSRLCVLNHVNELCSSCFSMFKGLPSLGGEVCWLYYI